MRFALSLLIFLPHASAAVVPDPLRVHLDGLGTVVGRFGTSQDGSGTREFLGIPFAEPPTGALRWHPPLPAAAWVGDLAANVSGPACPQLWDANEPLASVPVRSAEC